MGKMIVAQRPSTYKDAAFVNPALFTATPALGIYRCKAAGKHTPAFLRNGPDNNCATAQNVHRQIYYTAVLSCFQIGSHDQLLKAPMDRARPDLVIHLAALFPRH